MSLDQYFKELEVKSEKDLYKQSFRVALDSREALLEELQDEKNWTVNVGGRGRLCGSLAPFSSGPS